MIVVEFRGLGEDGKGKVYGRVSWDGHSLSQEGEIKDILKDPVRVGYKIEERRILNFKDDPETYLRALPQTYRSPYFCAVLVQE